MDKLATREERNPLAITKIMFQNIPLSSSR